MKVARSFILPLLCVFVPTHATLLKVPFSSKLVHLGDAILQTIGLDSREEPNAPLKNAIVKVVATVQAGSSQKFNDVLIDTGSAILWLGGEDPYRPGPNTQSLNTTFSVAYGVGSVSGSAFRDTVTIGEATASGQILGAANATSGFKLVTPIDGILGLGPSGSNAGQVGGAFSEVATPTFVETLVSEGSIEHAVFGVYIAPLGRHGEPEGEGELTFGGVDESRIEGDVTWVPQNPPINFHWEFNVTSFGFGNITLPDPAPARTDTGVLGIGIPFDTLFSILDAHNGTLTSSDALGALISLPANATHALPPLVVSLGLPGTQFSIPPAQYLIPRQLYASLNLTQEGGLAHTWINSAGPGTFLLGQTWLQGVYTAYDLEEHRVGFAHLA